MRDTVDIETSNGSAVVTREDSLHTTFIDDKDIPAFRVTRGWDSELDVDGTFLVSERLAIVPMLGPIRLAILVQENSANGLWSASLYAAAIEYLMGVGALHAAFDYVGITSEMLRECADQDEREHMIMECLVTAGSALRLSVATSTDVNASVQVAKLEAANFVQNKHLYLDRKINESGITGLAFLRGGL